jgi:hypothetical protein
MQITEILEILMQTFELQMQITIISPNAFSNWQQKLMQGQVLC